MKSAQKEILQGTFQNLLDLLVLYYPVVKTLMNIQKTERRVAGSILGSSTGTCNIWRTNQSVPEVGSGKASRLFRLQFSPFSENVNPNYQWKVFHW